MITKKRIISFIGIVLCVGLCFPGIYWYQSYKNNLSEIEENLNQYIADETNTSMENINESLDDATVDKAQTNLDLTEAYTKARTLGEKALELEEKHIDNIWKIEYDTEHWEEASDENIEISEEMQKLFLDQAPIRSTWYLSDPEQNVNPTWSFQIGLDYADGQIPVSWVCKTDDEEILTALVAQYDIESNIFWNSRLYQTYLGSQYAGYETSEASEDEEESISSNQFISGVKSISNAINEYIEQSPVEADEIPYKYDEDTSENSGR